jgi:ComF family protein
MRLSDPLIAPFRLIADAALPPRCPGCGAVTRADHRFCAACWNQLRFLAPPWCASCNTPFSIDRGVDARCAECLETPPRHAGVRAAVAYDMIPKAMALRLKYGGHLAYAETIARHMARLMPGDAEILIPVPLHARRLWGRGFNQAGEIARGLSRYAGVPLDVDSLRRVVATPLLRGLGAKARAEAVARAFAISPDRRARLADKAIVLVDDVYTSGATTGACTLTLLRAGARKVTILCWARVLDPAAAD